MNWRLSWRVGEEAVMRYHRPKVNKLVSLAFSVIVALNGGVSYAYGLWAPLLKRHGLDQRDVAILGGTSIRIHNLRDCKTAHSWSCSRHVVAAHAGFGAYSSFIAGLLYDRLERRQHVGPRLTLLVGCVVSSVGFFMLHRAISSETPVSFAVLVCVAILAGNGCTYFDVSPMSTNVRNFASERGWVIGIIKSSIGLSGGLYSIVFFQGLFHGDSAAFLRFLSWGPSALVLCCVPFVNYVPYLQESERCERTNTRRFQCAVVVIGVLALYVMGVSLVSGMMDVTPHLQGVFAVGAVIVLLPLFGITFDSGGLFAKEADMAGNEGVEAALLSPDGLCNAGSGIEQEGDAEWDGSDDDNTMRTHKQLDVRASHSLQQCLCASPEFYLLGAATGIGIASGLTFLNNSPQIVGSLGGSGQEQTIVVAFFSCASCFGRLGFGAASEMVTQRYKLSRAWFLMLAGAGSALVYTLLSMEFFVSPMMLYPLSLISGLFFGGHWAVMPNLASELHGLTSFASIYSVLQLFPGVIAYLLGTYVGQSYDSIGRAQGDPPGQCTGPHCFAGSFRTISVLSFVGLALSVTLWHRTSRRFSGWSARYSSEPSQRDHLMR